MNINATLLVQACNFIVLYAMLRFLLFKPAVTIIEQEKDKKNAMLTSIDQQKRSLEIQEKERQKHWYTCQEYFILQQPQLRKTTFFPFYDNEYTPVAPEVTSDATRQTALTIYDILSEKIKHVH